MGKIVIFSAPSGSGKTTLVKHLLQSNLNLEFSISATNREPREGEVDGRDYYFLDTQTFKKHIEAGDFLEWEEVYKGRFYGTLKSEVQRIWDKGNHVVFDVDVKGGLNIKNQYQDKALAVFVMPPSFAVLKERLKERRTESEQELDMRIAQAKQELSYAQDFDIVLVNDRLDMAKEKAVDIVKDFFSSISRI